jgi:hypothetical protein
MLVCCPKQRREDIRKRILVKSVMKRELIRFNWGESDTSNATGVINHKLCMCQRHDRNSGDVGVGVQAVDLAAFVSEIPCHQGKARPHVAY